MSIEAKAERARIRNELVAERQRQIRERHQNNSNEYRLDAEAQRRLRFEAAKLAATTAINTARHMNELRRYTCARRARPSTSDLHRSRSRSSMLKEQVQESDVQVEQRRLDFYREMRRSWDLEYHRPPPVMIPSDEKLFYLA